jgi:PAS domain S-box-containing protein
MSEFAVRSRNTSALLRSGAESGSVPFEALFRSLPENIVVVRADDPSFTIVAVSDIHLQLIRATREEIVGCSFFEAYPEGPDSAHAATMRQLRVSFRRVIETGQPDTMPMQRYDLPRHDSNGGDLEERYWSPVNSPVTGPDNVVEFVIHRAEDVTALVQLRRKEEAQEQRADAERLRAEQIQAELLFSSRILGESERLIEQRDQLVKDLKQSEARFRAAIGAFTSLLWTNNALGQMEGEQPGWAEFTGQSYDEYKGFGWSRAVHPDDAQPTVEAWKQAVAERKMFVFEHRVRRHDGVYRLFSIRAVPVIHNGGEISEWVGVHTDITEERELVQALRQSEDRFRRALEIETVGVIFFDPSGLIKRANDAFLRMGGYTEEDVASGRLRWDILTPPEWMRASEVAIQQLKTAGSTIPYEKEYYRKDGSRWMGVFAAKLLSEHDAVEFILDVTERKRLERTLANREERYHALFTSIDEGFCVGQMLFDESGRPADYRFLEMNPWFEQATGLSRETALGKTAKEVVNGLEELWVERYGHVVQSGQAERFENYSAAMGRWFRVYAFPVGGDQFALLFSDVTAEKAAEAEQSRLLQQIESERQRLQQVFAQSPVAIIVFRGRDFVVELANPPYQALVQGRELVGHPFRDVMPELGQDVWDVFHRVLDTGEPYTADEWHVPYDADRDGVLEDHWFNVNYHPFREPDGSVSGFIAVLTEVTTQVLARKELERVNKELEEFAYIASHDLQEPLRMVNIYSQLLTRRFVPNEPQAKEYAGLVEEGVNRMQLLIRDLLTYSRTVQREELPVGPADLSMALSEARSVLHNRIEESGADIQAEKLPVVCGNMQQIAHVFQNLLSNALKYRKPDVSPQIRISAKRDGKQWIIAVQDNGIGFDQQYAERIFGLFKRLHNTEYPGTGVGLAICQRIIERYGGRMWAEGKPQVGAIFYFALPAIEVE